MFLIYLRIFFGALALAVANRTLMLEHAVFSVLSPEGFASILWKDASRSTEAAGVMKLTAQDLYDGGVVHAILKEPEGGAHTDWTAVFRTVDTARIKLAFKTQRPEIGREPLSDISKNWIREGGLTWAGTLLHYGQEADDETP